MNSELMLAATMLAAAVPAAASAQSIEGRWANPKRSVVVAVDRCGAAYCGWVAQASEKNRTKVAAKGRTLIGLKILTDLKPAGNGVYKGQALEPKRNIRGSATVRQLGPNVMVVKGCAVLGVICREQRWTRVSQTAGLDL